MAHRARASLLLSAGVLGLLAWSALAPGGLRRHQRLAAEAGRLAAENREIARENVRLRREVRALNGEPAALERAAREELNFVRPGEMVFQLDGGGRR